MTEEEMVEQHHLLDGHEVEQAPGVGDGQGSLVCCSPWGHKESDTTEPLSLTELKGSFIFLDTNPLLNTGYANISPLFLSAVF